MAMAAGADYVTPLVGRLQDQGCDALELIKQCVKAVDHYGYPTKIMFSSVRHPEHVRNAINLGVHTCTVPWKVMKLLTENTFTAIGTQNSTVHRTYKAHDRQDETLALSGLGNHLYTRELNSLADTRKKEEVMLSLFLVAAVDKNISPEENEELRLISKSLGFSESDFYEFRAMFKEFLSVLK